MIQLDLQAGMPALRFKRSLEKRWVFDLIRKKWVVLQPEELVRQLAIQYLLNEKGYLASHMRVEMGLAEHFAEKRCDVLVFDRAMQPFLLLECKAPSVTISEAVFRQISSYNLPLAAPFLMITNGHTTYGCAMDYEQNDWTFLTEIPAFPKGRRGE